MSKSSDNEKDLAGKLVFLEGRRLERPESSLAENIKDLLPKGAKAALSSLSRDSAQGKLPGEEGLRLQLPLWEGFSGLLEES